MTSPAMVMLWESWMLTRWGYLSRLVIALVFILLVSTVYETRERVDESDLLALRLICGFVCLLCGLSALGVGRSQDGRSGFPFYLGFSRPAPTWLQVIIPMTYRTVCCTALYLIPILVTHFAYGMTNLSIASALVIVPITLMIQANSWWTDRKGISRLIVSVTVYFSIAALIYYTLHYNELTRGEDPFPIWWSFSFSLQDYLIILLVSVVAVLVTLAGVESQRHGDEVLDFWQSKTSSVLKADSDWFAELYQIECPTTSAKRAELWSEINGRGLPAFVWSLLTALSIPMLWYLSNLLDSEPLFGIGTGIAVCVPIAAAPTLGIVTKQGSAYMSTFDATRPLNTAWLTGMKMGVAVVSMIAGMLMIAISFWLSTPLVEGFIGGVEIGRQNILNYFESASIVELVLLILVRLVQFSTIVAFMATLHTTYALYADRITFGVLGLLLYSCVLPILLATKVVPVSFGLGHVWPWMALMMAGAYYFLYSMAKNSVISVGQITVFVFLWFLYVLAYFYLLREDDLFASDTPLEFIAFRACVCLLSLVLIAMAPWSLAMTRHR